MLRESIFLIDPTKINDKIVENVREEEIYRVNKNWKLCPQLVWVAFKTKEMRTESENLERMERKYVKLYLQPFLHQFKTQRRKKVNPIPFSLFIFKLVDLNTYYFIH